MDVLNRMRKAFSTALEVDLECNVIRLLTGGMFSLARLAWGPRYSTLCTRWSEYGSQICAANLLRQRFIHAGTPDDGRMVVETYRSVQLGRAGIPLT